MKRFTQNQIIKILAFCLCLMQISGMFACAEDIANDLAGGFVGVQEGSVDSFEAQANIAIPDMETADLIMGYVGAIDAKLNPLLCTEWALISVNQLIFESVVDLDENLKPSPMLADSWTHEDKIWTFKLRNGITFHNGYDLTAYDVVQSYSKILEAGSKNPYYSRVNSLIDDMMAVDDRTVAVKGKYSGYVTLYGMTFPVMQYSTVSDAIPRGTGPYWFIQIDANNNIRLEANPLWWKKQPQVSSILILRYDEIGDALQAIQTNEIEMITTKSSKAALSRKLGDITSMDYATLTYEMMIPNLNSASIMSDPNVRKAVMYAIDRSNIASSAYVDMAIQCEVPLPPSSWLYESQSAVYYYSPERALQLMNQAGWHDMTGNSLLNKLNGIMLEEAWIDIITYNESTNSIRENAANLIAKYLNDIGINTTVTVLSRSKCLDRIEDKDYDIALVGVNLSEVPNLSAILSSGGKLNLNHHTNETVDKLLSSAASAANETELKQIYSQIQLSLVDRLPIMGLLFRTGTVLSTRSMAGMYGIRAFDSFNGLEFIS